MSSEWRTNRRTKKRFPRSTIEAVGQQFGDTVYLGRKPTGEEIGEQLWRSIVRVMEENYAPKPEFSEALHAAGEIASVSRPFRDFMYDILAGLNHNTTAEPKIDRYVGWKEAELLGNLLNELDVPADAINARRVLERSYRGVSDEESERLSPGLRSMAVWWGSETDEFRDTVRHALDLPTPQRKALGKVLNGIDGSLDATYALVALYGAELSPQ